MRSKRVAWSTLTKSVSKVLSSVSTALELMSGSGPAAHARVWTCFLQYSMTLERILALTLGLLGGAGEEVETLGEEVETLGEWRAAVVFWSSGQGGRRDE
jgi:hypothetical protein